MGWSIEPTGEGILIDNDGLAKLPKNSGDTDITYNITYSKDGFSSTCDYTVKPCECGPTCDCKWTYEFSTITPVIQGFDTGGTPIDVIIKCDGNLVSDLEDSDLIVNISNAEAQADLNPYCHILAKPETGRYIISIIKNGDESKLCKYIGDALNCTLATVSCPEQAGSFKIKIEQYESWNMIIQGCKSGQSSIYIGFYYKVGTCGKELKVGEVQAVRAVPDDGYLHHKINIHKGAILDRDVRFVLANAGNYCQAPTCAKIITHVWPNLYVLYCPDGPCNQ
jgi:hypothetical protein